MKAPVPVKQVKRSHNKDCRFSILIPTWNNLDYLRLCIGSIRKNSLLNHQIIVHINEGKDGTLEWIAAQQDIDYSYSEQNIGVCYALNSCRSLAETDYILYLNDDMYVCPGWDQELSAEIEKAGHKYFFFSSTAIEPVAQSPCSIEKNFGNNPAAFEEQKLLGEYASFEKQDWQGSTWPPNIVHRDVWDLVGGYSTEFSPGMYSDPDFSFKLWQLGVRLFKGISKSRVYHFGSVSVNRIRKNRGYYTFVAKWGVTQHTFSKYYLHRGETFSGPLQDPLLNRAQKLNNLFKQLKAAFFRS